MKIFLDTANLTEIKKIYDIFPKLQGITTNPTILSKNFNTKEEALKSSDLTEFCLKNNLELHIQITDYSDIIENALNIKRTYNYNYNYSYYYKNDSIYVKIPCSNDGLKAAAICKEEGLNVTMTAIFSENQAILAAEAGVDYIAPYINRINNSGGDGIKTVSNIVKIYNNYNYKTKILAASFKETDQIYKLALSGCNCITVSPDLFYKMIEHSGTIESIERFKKDWNDKFEN